MKELLRALVPLLAAPLLVSPSALAQAEPVHVSADATFDAVSPGGFQEVGCLVENRSGQTLLAHFTLFVTYADGTVQAFRLNQPPTTLGPDEAFILFIAFAVPEDAALGTATFTCTVRALGSGGMGFAQSATAAFEVV